MTKPKCKPPVINHEKKIKWLQVRVSRDTHNNLKSLSKSLGVSMSEMVTAIVRKRIVKKRK